MIADTFRKDYRQMTAQGVKFTPDDIVLLNALAVKVRLSQNAARTTHLPRLAFLPKRRSGILAAFEKEVVLREPTIAHEMWIEKAARYITVDSDRTFDLLYGYALSRPAEKLVSTENPKRLIRAVFMFAARHLAFLTREQLSSAVDYCLFGADWTVGERGPKKPADKSSTAETAKECASPTIGLLTEARAIRLPITLDDAMRMTASELNESITRCLANEHKIDYDAEYHRAMGEYVRARNEIMKRSEKAATEASPESRTTSPSNGSNPQGGVR